MTIYHKGEAWPEERYVDPTAADRAAHRAIRQSRCPHDLDEMDRWSEKMWIDWGYELMETGATSNVEGHALAKACRHYEWTLKFVAELDELLTNIEKENTE